MAKTIKIEIKNKHNGNVIFEHEQVDNTIKDTVTEAIKRGVSLQGADLRYADLQGINFGLTDLRTADLTEANLQNSVLYFSDISFTVLRGANLQGANLSDTMMFHTDLHGANLTDANLNGAKLIYTDFTNANLQGADLAFVEINRAYFGDANLTDVKNMPYVPFACPTEGSFIGWKKVNNSHLIKLLIPEDARRSSATGRNCRCDHAKVLEITNLQDNAIVPIVENKKHSNFIYETGKDIYPDSYDENRWNECTHGIHFFVDKQEALGYFRH